MSIFKQIAFILSVVILSFLVGYAISQAWTEPTEAPPDGNVSAPVNIGSTAQTKQGALQVTADFTANRLLDTSDNSYYIDPANTGYSALFAGNVGIGTTSPQTKLDVAGAVKIGTQTTCDANTAGAIRYNSAGEKFEGCNGTNWQLIALVSSCGDSVNFTYKGASVTYGTVLSLGKCWMDRNLGATKVAASYNDCTSYPSNCAYGDLFQWGRLDDNHQTRTSGTTSTLSSTDNPGHGNFILAPNSPYDWRSPQNNNLWQGESGTNNPCPDGWRIPTETEWDTERASWSQQNYNGAYASPLKLTAGGIRGNSDGSLNSVGSIGYYWSSGISDAGARYLGFTSTSATMSSGVRAYGLSVRCVQD